MSLFLPSSGEGLDFCIGSAGFRRRRLQLKAEKPKPGEPGRSGWVLSAGSWPLHSASPSGVSPAPTLPLSPLGTARAWEGHGEPPNRSPPLQGRFESGEVVLLLVGPRNLQFLLTWLGWVAKRAGGMCFEGLVGLGP